MKGMIHVILGFFLFFWMAASGFAEDGFTQKDRELLIELRVKMTEIDKRFEQVDKRFEQVDKRFEQVDKRFEQVDKRLDQMSMHMNMQFEQLYTFLYILSGIFTTLVAVVIGFAWWDRRTMIREARRETVEFIEKEGLLRRLLDAMREVAAEDKRLARALERFNLL
jgi:hypothetical protein